MSLNRYIERTCLGLLELLERQTHKNGARAWQQREAPIRTGGQSTGGVRNTNKYLFN